jgi:hypothetical protein
VDMQGVSINRPSSVDMQSVKTYTISSVDMHGIVDSPYQ